MKKCAIGMALILPLIYAGSLFAGARGGDPAWALLHGEPDRLHQSWPGYPKPPQDGTKSLNNTPAQEVQPQQPQQDLEPKGDTKK